MKVPSIIGADLSKKTIDVAIHSTGKHLKISNDKPGFHLLVKWLNQQSINIADMIIVMEHTGFYSYQFEEFLHQQSIRFSKMPGLAIKRSLGLVRGKNDKQDAARIARYGFEKMDTLIIAPPPNTNLQRLQLLHSLKDRLVRNRASFIATAKELQQVCELKRSDILVASQLALVKKFDQQVNKLEQQIHLIIESDKQLNQNYLLLLSIRGVGKVLALSTIIKTGNFTRFTNARKFACHCGIAPFENTSGTSVRGKTKVSNLADKRMKSVLDMAAKSSIQYDKELRQYYLRRTESGKSKMSTLNVVRNKLLYRMFAVIKRQTPFIENYPKAA
jgi:transposase